MSIIKYEIVNKVAFENSFTKAAEALGMTQSAVSHAVSSLEREFGFVLFHRNRAGLTLTNEGEAMLRKMRLVLEAEELVQQEATNLLGMTTGTLRIGVISSISSSWMPGLIQMMDTHYPGITIDLREGDYYEIERWLTNGEIDAGFLNAMNSDQFQYITLRKDPLLCVVSKESRFYSKSKVDIYELQDEPFVLISYRGDNDVLRLLDKYEVKPDIRFVLSEEMGVLSMIVHHIGITILPQMSITYLPKGLKVVPLMQGSYRTIGIALRKNPSPAATKFVSILRDWVDEQS
ncbi:MAG TPA: LysR family transcriptional regulator [Metalysinibacillus sp.]